MIVRIGPLRPTALSLVWLSLLLTACSDASGNRFHVAGHWYDSDHVTHLGLPKPLREVSGLASAAPGRVFAHNDERGVVFEIDYLAPSIEPILTLADDVRDDFEGIATLGERLFLVTSHGVLYETRITADDAAPFTRYDGGLDCEVEGLTAAPDRAGLLVACKNLPDDRHTVVIHYWHLEKRAYDSSPALSIPTAIIADFLSGQFPERPPPKRIQPTGITVTSAGNLLLVAARQHLLLEFTPEGTPVAAAKLDPDVHRQAEGVEVDTDGRLLLASEGDGKGEKKTRGVLSIYEPID